MNQNVYVLPFIIGFNGQRGMALLRISLSNSHLSKLPFLLQLPVALTIQSLYRWGRCIRLCLSQTVLSALAENCSPVSQTEQGLSQLLLVNVLESEIAKIESRTVCICALPMNSGPCGSELEKQHPYDSMATSIFLSRKKHIISFETVLPKPFWELLC